MLWLCELPALLLPVLWLCELLSWMNSRRFICRQFIQFVGDSFGSFVLNAVHLLFAGGGEQFGKALRNIAGTAFGFGICLIFIPKFFDTLDISCTQSWLVCAPHEYSLWPLHLALVLSVCLVHCLVNLWSVGNLNELTPSLWELLHPATTQCFPCSDARNHSPLCVTQLPHP